MKRTFQLYIYIIGMLSLLICSCTKEKASTPDFDVQISGTFKAGQPVTFTFSGNPDYLTFWSGEKGHNYENRNRTIEHGTSQILKFTSLATTASQTGNVKLMISTDFDGTYAAADIAKATWTDISARAVLSTGTSIASGNVALTDIAALNKPCYLGFYYYAPQTALKPATWTISAPTVTNTLADGTASTVIANFAAAGFQAVDLQNPAKTWAISTTTMVMNGGAAGDPVNEDWVISTAINLNAVVAPDYGVGIKSVDALLPNYSYTFAAAGTYNITFVAANTNVDDSKSIIKQMSITITP